MTQPLELISCDLFGPMTKEWLGKSYVLTIIDNYSRVINQPQNPISHSSPAPDINYDTPDPASYVYIELFLPLYLLPVLLQLIQYLTLVFMWN